MTLAIRRVDRLVATSVLGSLAGVWLVHTGFDAATHFLGQLGNIGRNDCTLADPAIFILVTTPRRAYEMFGFAALIGGLSGLAATGELTALSASGMSRLRIATSATGVVALLIVGVAILGETAALWGDQLAQAMKLRRQSGNLGNTGSDLWARDGGRMINARHPDAQRRRPRHLAACRRTRVHVEPQRLAQPPRLG